MTHVWLFDTVFRGTTVRYQVVNAAPLAGLMKAHVTAHVSGLTPELHTLASVVFADAEAGWRVALFHNTEVSRFEP